MEFSEFIKEVKKTRGPKKHKVSNSYSIKTMFYYYRKIRPKTKSYVLTESQYYHIIRTINNALREQLINGNDVILPYKLGKIEIRKYKNVIEFKDGKLKTDRPIDWNSTLKLWYDNPICREKKQLIRFENNETFMVHYDKRKAVFKNKDFYEFDANRYVKIGLKKNILSNKLEAFTK